MQSPELSAGYWDNRYRDRNTGWDIGYPSPPLIEYAMKCIPRDAKILIPGAGRGYESAFLFHSGFTGVYNMDFSERAKTEFIQRVPSFPEEQYLTGDFFALTDTFDYVLEQTFFCALDLQLRKAYVDHMHKILRTNGILAGVLFEMDKADGPPFGGNRAEYLALFNPKFEILKMEPCYNSIEPRMGSELFFELKKRNESSEIG